VGWPTVRWTGRSRRQPRQANAVKTSAGDLAARVQAFNARRICGISNKPFCTLTFGRHNGLMLDLLQQVRSSVQGAGIFLRSRFRARRASLARLRIIVWPTLSSTNLTVARCAAVSHPCLRQRPRLLFPQNATTFFGRHGLAALDRRLVLAWCTVTGGGKPLSIAANVTASQSRHPRRCRDAFGEHPGGHRFRTIPVILGVHELQREGFFPRSRCTRAGSGSIQQSFPYASGGTQILTDTSSAHLETTPVHIHRSCRSPWAGCALFG